MIWDFDVGAAPRSGRVIVATSDGTVTISQWLAKTERWEMLGKNESPIAWMPWPKHPQFTQRLAPGTMKGDTP